MIQYTFCIHVCRPRGEGDADTGDLGSNGSEDDEEDDDMEEG